MEKYADLTAITLVTLVALSFGIAMLRLKQPAIVGYIIAGVALGPTGLAIVDNTEVVTVLADLGVIMLLFVIGMELSLRSFKSVLRVAVLTALMQIAMSFGIAYAASVWLGFSIQEVVLLTFVIALSSTAVVIKILDNVGELRTDLGRTAVGVLIAQDIAVAPMLLIVSDLGQEGFDPSIVLKLGLAIGLLIAVIWFLSRRERLRIPFMEKLADKSDMAPVAALAVCFGFATASGIMGMSSAYGAFLAGLIIGNSNIRSQLMSSIKPIETVLLVVFFLSVGLLIDLPFIEANWQLVLGALATVTVAKTAINVIALRLLGQSWNQAFIAGALLGQVGEFSFILAAAGLAAGVIDPDRHALIISVIALSLLISPVWKSLAQRAHDMAAERKLKAGAYFGTIFRPELMMLKRCTGVFGGSDGVSAGGAEAMLGVNRREQPPAPGKPAAEADKRQAADAS